MEVKKIVEGMTAVEVAEVIESNFKNQNKILEEDIAKQNSVIGVSEYKDFSEAEAVNVGDVRKYNGLLYECVEATTGAFDASKWKKSSFKAETEKKLSELGSKVDLNTQKVNKLNTSESLEADFAISDGKGNDIVRFVNGHIKTKNFNSETEDSFPSDFEISDNTGHSIVKFVNGHIRTKNFNSETEDTFISDFAISDGKGNDIVWFVNGHIKTKNFNSENIEADYPQTNSAIFSGCVDFNLDEWDITNFNKDGSVFYSTTPNATILSKASFGIDNRDYSIVFSLPNEQTQVVFGTIYEYNAKFSSAILVDSINNKIELLKAFDGTPVSLDEPVSISVPLTTGIYYKIDIKVRGRKVEFSIYRLTTTNCISFDLLGTKEYDTQIIGYSSYSEGTWGYEAGTWKGKSIIKLITGEVRLYGYQHIFACAKNPYIYCFGDSITEGFSVRDGEKYGDVLRSIFGENNVVISGIGGDTTTSSMLRFKSELSILKPYNVLLYLGSNYESSTIFKQNYMEMLQILSDLKCNIILGTIPTQADITVIVKELAKTFNAKIVDFDSLLKIDGVLNREYYYNYDYNNKLYNDNIHPNAIGEYLMATSIANIIK